MTLDEALDGMRKQVDAMGRSWRRKHSEDPEGWPMDMHAGEWDESYLTIDWVAFEERGEWSRWRPGARRRWRTR